MVLPRNEGVAGSSPVFGFQEMAYLRRLRQRRSTRLGALSRFIGVLTTI